MTGRLPPLREELALLPGPVLADGQPSHVLHDPVRNQFFQIDWPTFEVLSRWHLGDPGAIAAAIGADTTLQLDGADVERVAGFFADNELLRQPPGSAAACAARLRRKRGGVWQWLLHNYLFFRIPLVKPDRWLGRVAPRLGFFYSRQFLYLTLGALGWGLVEVYRQYESFAATLVGSLGWGGLASYGAALAGVKILHELGHAVTAKRMGCKVPAMGIAFIVMAPVAYTDTNEVWKLTRRRQRLAVVGAGMLTELAVAAWATFGWAVLPEGTPRSIAFLLATTTWIASLAINSSPFMRFDGYFLLSDWLEMPNLHARAFALARWDLRERLFDLGAAPPEHFPPPRRRGLILFAYATWVYRLAVFLGIAALVYAFFIKAVGVMLFAVEIGVFVLLPLLREVKAWGQLWPVLRSRARARRSAVFALALAVLLALPWPTRLAGGGLLHPAAQFVVYAPPHAQVAALPVAEGQHVAAGTVLLRLDSPDLSARLASAQARLDQLGWATSAGTFDSEQRAQWQVAQEQFDAAKAELAAVRADAARYRPAAPFAGTLRDLEPGLRPGTWLAAQEPLATLVSDRGQVVTAYLGEEDVGRIALGDKARFYADAPGGPVVPLVVSGIDPDATRVLPDPELAALFGGSIVVREKRGEFYPVQPVYRVTLEPAAAVEGAAQHAWRGRVVISGRPVSPAWRYLRGLLALFWREAGF